MITPSFGLTATERVLPKLALDFTTASLDSRITFTRTTDATHPASYVNSSGTLAYASNNAPRFDYDPVTLACKGLLIEESRSNLFPTSVNPTYNYSATTIVTNSATTAPDGTSDGQSLVPNTTNTSHLCDRYQSMGTTGAFTLSVYLKANGYYKGQLRLAVSAGGFGTDFDLNAITVANTTAGATASIVDAGNGWRRCQITATMAGTSGPTQRVQLYNNSGSASFAGDGTSGIYVWGFQLEAGAFATSYIPTTTAALTRNADVATMTGTNFSDWFNASEGTYACEYQVAQYNAALAQMVLSSGSAAAIETYMACNTSNVNQFTVANTANQANFGSLGAVTLNTPAKICGFYKANYFSAAGNGTTSGGLDTSGTVPTMNKLVFGARNDGARPLNGHIRTVEYWPFTLTTNEILAYSKP
jgi:hypothetical protein